MLIDPVPVTALAVNCSPIPRLAPPPFGNEMDGAWNISDLGEVLISVDREPASVFAFAERREGLGTGFRSMITDKLQGVGSFCNQLHKSGIEKLMK